MSQVIWTLPGCHRCERARGLYPAAEVRSLSALASAGEPDSDLDVRALAQYAFQDWEAPVVWDGGRFVPPWELDE